MRLIAAMVAAAMPTAALAGVLDIPGTYGNPAGCRYVKTQNYSEEDMVILSPDEYTTYVTLCEFVDMKKTRGGARVLTTVCGHEGEGYETIEFMRVVPSIEKPGAFDIFDAGGEARDTVEACK